jgi:hypothetical protein
MAAYDPLDPGQERPEPPEITPWPGEPVWCRPCQARISQRLAQLDDLASILARYADGHRDAPDGPMVSGTAETMSPSAAQDMADDLARMLGGWESAYRELTEAPTPRRNPDQAEWITACSAWLAARLPRILASPMGEDFGHEILSWHREMTAQAKAGTRKLRKPLRCPGCQMLTLTWTEGDESVYCGNPACRMVMRYAEYEAEVSHRAGAA